MNLRRSFYITVAVFAGFVLLANLLLDEPKYDSPEEKARFEQASGRPELAVETFRGMIDSDISNIDAHYDYICTHFDIPQKREDDDHNYIFRDDVSIAAFYDSLSGSADNRIADIGHYGSGLITVFQEVDPLEALGHFSRVGNDRLKYLNNSIGNVYRQIDSLDQAELHFRKEIRYAGNLEGAYGNLAYLLYFRGDSGALRELMEEDTEGKYFPLELKRAMHFNDFRPLAYFSVLLKSLAMGINTWGVLAAFLIMMAWVVYLRKLDIFESEKWSNVILTVVLGMIFTFLVYPLSDFNNMVLEFYLDGRIFNDFMYCVFGIGAVEELVKIIPFLIMLRFSKAINEPFDYIKYASLSALGFAFVENMVYFREDSLNIIHGRALTAVVAHMFDSSVIAYGIMLNKYKRRRNPLLNFLFFFLLASLAHGFYDFWLINHKASQFSFLTIIFLLVCLVIWNSLKNNALNQSGFFDASKTVNHGKIEDFLLYSLAGVLLFEFIAIAFKYGPEVAGDSMMSSLYTGTYLMFFISSSLGKVDLHRGEWVSFRDWFRRKRPG